MLGRLPLALVSVARVAASIHRVEVRVGRDVLLAEPLAHALEQRFNARAMSAVVSGALSGVDIALWDVQRAAHGGGGQQPRRRDARTDVLHDTQLTDRV